MSTLDNNLLDHAFSGISFDPERRAASTRADFNNDIAEYAEIVKDLPNAEELTEHYRAGLAARYNKWLASSSRCVSWFIAGPSKFPVRRQQKAMNIESKRMHELAEWQSEQIRKAYSLVRKSKGQGPIMSSDADAPEQLRKKIAHLEAVHALVVAANKQIRKDADAAKIWIAEQRDQHPACVYSDFLKVINSYAYYHCNGGIYGATVAPYWLSNDSQNIKRLKGRLTEIEKKREIYTTAENYTAEDGTQIEFDGEANRIRLIFEDKPEPEMRDKLKKAGFKWSPKAGAWQNFINYTANKFLESEFPRPCKNAEKLTFAIKKKSGSYFWNLAIMPADWPEEEPEKEKYRHFLISGMGAAKLAEYITLAKKNNYPYSSRAIINGSGHAARQKFLELWLDFSDDDFIWNEGDLLPDDAPEDVREAFAILEEEETEETPTRSTLPDLPPAQIEPEPRHHAEKEAPGSLADAADMLNMRDFRYVDKQGVLRSLDLRGVEKCTTWQALHDENGILCYHTEKDENGKPHRVYHFRNIAESFLRFSRGLLDSPAGQAAWKSCGGGHIVGYDQQNPARICGMAALWGLEDIGGQFFRTPRAWKNAGYELKPTARPFFVVTPKFTQKNEKTTDEETGEEVEQITITGAAGKFNMFPVYCSADVVQVREIKRRAPRQATRPAESAELEAAYAAARQEVATATATTGAPRKNVIAAMASPSKTRQLTLAL